MSVQALILANLIRLSARCSSTPSGTVASSRCKIVKILLPDFHSATYEVMGQFTPVLKAYVVSNYQQSEILRGAIQTPVIWTQDLSTLSESSSFSFTYDPPSGKYAITQDLSAKAVIRPVLGVGASHGDEIKKIFNVLAETLSDPRHLEAMVKNPQHRAEKLKLLRRLETLTGLTK
jgi:hypothetical protein